MAKQYWLMKSEPDAYAWEQLVKDGTGMWDGVRNHTAKLNLMAMKVGDEALFYHSNIGVEAVGIMEIVEEAAPDSTDETGKWAAVKVKPKTKFARTVPLRTSMILKAPVRVPVASSRPRRSFAAMPKAASAPSSMVERVSSVRGSRPMIFAAFSPRRPTAATCTRPLVLLTVSS